MKVVTTIFHANGLESVVGDIGDEGKDVRKVKTSLRKKHLQIPQVVCFTLSNKRN
jgi:hypothetical protein